MTFSICVTCGVQHARGDVAPATCAVCEDERQYVRWDGQAWTTADELAKAHTLVMREDDGVPGFGVEPRFAIGQRALLARTPHGNVLWDCLSMVTDEAVAAIRAYGGADAIAISHPHYYGAMVDWSRALGGVPIHIHEEERRWVMRPDPSVRFWDGERLALNPALTLVRCGGHFAGAQVLHWSRAQDAVLLAGDVLQVTPTRRRVSFMYSYPNHIPLNAAAVRRIAASLDGFAFDSIYGAWWGQNVIGGGRAVLEESVSRYLAAIAD